MRRPGTQIYFWFVPLWFTDPNKIYPVDSLFANIINQKLSEIGNFDIVEVDHVDVNVCRLGLVQSGL